MPEKEQPNFPIGEKPYLSPNPNDPGFQPKDGGRETPAIVGTAPKKQEDLDTDQSQAINSLGGRVSTLETKTAALEAKKSVTSIDGKDGLVTTDATLSINESKVLGLTGELPYLTTAPTEANTGGIRIVVLSAEPATYYDGYLYFITGAAQNG